VSDISSDVALNADQFRQFLTLVQGESSKEADKIIGDVASITYKQFCQYFDKDEHSAYSYASRQMCMDMSQPWIHYFMNSSHNTYLTGDQIQSQSSTDAYSMALIAGCRCVELDCWDGPDGEPIVYHGFTLTSRITFREIIEVIKRDAFMTSSYPVVLSLENHCSLEQQDRMADIMKSVFTDTLVMTPVLSGQIPHPDSLKYKVIVKTKALKSHAQDVPMNNVTDNGDENDDEDEDEVEAVKAVAEIRKDRATSKISPALARLAIHMISKTCKSLEGDVVKFTGHNVASISEAKTWKWIYREFDHMLKFTSQTFTRIYPAGYRIDSSNYNPIACWQAGCQVVALNYQTLDTPMQINHGFFLQNGNCGYVLKPRFMRTGGPRLSKLRGKKISLTVFSGYRFPKPRDETETEVVDPYVVAELWTPTLKNHYLVQCDQVKTKWVHDNGFNPVWFDLNAAKNIRRFPHESGKTKFVFRTPVKYPETSFLRLAVYDHDYDSVDDFLAFAVIPINCLREGYRFVRLYDHRLQLLETSHLFVYIRTTAL
jgi:phosphatidylinositol phospholipase C delta